MKRRVRRSAPAARRLILDAAEKQLAQRGPDGVQVQDVASDVGVVPATVLHHFGSRNGLLDELMSYGAKRLEERLADLVSAAKPDLVTLGEELLDLYASRGYAALYASIARRKAPHARKPGSGPLSSLLHRLEAARGLTTRRLRERAAFAVLTLNLVAFAEAHVGQVLEITAGRRDADGTLDRTRFVRFRPDKLATQCVQAVP